MAWMTMSWLTAEREQYIVLITLRRDGFLNDTSQDAFRFGSNPAFLKILVSPCLQSRSRLPSGTFAVRRSVCGIPCGGTNSVAVISGDMILDLQPVWSRVAAMLRSPFRQKGPTVP